MLRSIMPRWLASAYALGAMAVMAAAPSLGADTPWKRHVIDSSSRGADGVRLADVNGDGLMDITTGWEEGGVIRVYLHPGHAKAKEKWPAVTVGKVKSPEDAVFVDLDGDGAVDVVSSCEGNTKTMFVHWAPKEKAKYLDETAWKTEAFPATQGKQMWMYCLPMQVDGKGGIDLIVGSKGDGACVGWLESPANPRDLKAWKLHEKYKAGWIMSIVAADVDLDGEATRRHDLIISDRKGSNRGVHWLKVPEPDAVAEPWKVHTIGEAGHEVMFLDAIEFQLEWIVNVAVKPNRIASFRGGDDQWISDGTQYPLARFGTAKAVRVRDMNGDSIVDAVVSCEGASDGKSGVFMIDGGKEYTYHDISGPEGVKFDLIELIDLDGDGDLDVLTCEERDNLGVIWYENPLK